MIIIIIVCFIFRLSSISVSSDDEHHSFATPVYTVAMGNDLDALHADTDVTIQQALLELEQRAQQTSIDSCSLNSDDSEVLSVESGFFSDDVVCSGASSVASGSDVADVTRCHSPAPSYDVIVDLSPMMTSRL